MEFYNDYRDHYNVLTEYKASYGSDNTNGNDEFTQKMKELLAVMTNTGQFGIDNGDYREIDPAMLSLFLASFTEGMLQFKKMGFFDSMNISDTDFRRFMADIVWSGIKKDP